MQTVRERVLALDLSPQHFRPVDMTSSGAYR